MSNSTVRSFMNIPKKLLVSLANRIVHNKVLISVKSKNLAYIEPALRPKLDNDNNDIKIVKRKPKVDWRGRYDNRIKSGDELYWYEKFDKAQFDVNDFEKIYNELYFESDDINHC